MKIYYSHHTWKYNTLIEKFEKQCIEKQFKDSIVVNPLNVLPQNQPDSTTHTYACKAIDDCDAIVFSTFSGMIDQECFNEIIYAFNTGKEVYQLYGMNCIRLESYEDFMNHGIRDFIYQGDNRLYAIVNYPYTSNGNMPWD